jgi:hypothetical protein
MTIHWKALEKHFLMVTLVFRFTEFLGKSIFSEFFSKNLSFKNSQEVNNFNIQPEHKNSSDMILNLFTNLIKVFQNCN